MTAIQHGASKSKNKLKKKLIIKAECASRVLNKRVFHYVSMIQTHKIHVRKVRSMAKNGRKNERKKPIPRSNMVTVRLAKFTKNSVAAAAAAKK